MALVKIEQDDHDNDNRDSTRKKLAGELDLFVAWNGTYTAARTMMDELTSVGFSQVPELSFAEQVLALRATTRVGGASTRLGTSSAVRSGSTMGWDTKFSSECGSLRTWCAW